MPSYSYANLSTCIKVFYQDIIQNELRMKISDSSSYNENPTFLKHDEIEMIHLGDTRHLAMINLIISG
jgi:hypothetical protein